MMYIHSSEVALDDDPLAARSKSWGKHGLVAASMVVPVPVPAQLVPPGPLAAHLARPCLVVGGGSAGGGAGSSSRGRGAPPTQAPSAWGCCRHGGAPAVAAPGDVSFGDTGAGNNH